MLKSVGWMLAFVLVLFPVVYVIIKWDNQSFRESAIAGCFGTVVGVIVGVPVALWLARMQQNTQEAAEANRRAKEREEQLQKLSTQLSEEVTFNLGAVEQLQEVLAKTPKARADIWDWATRIAESFEFSARRQFESVLLTPIERASDAPVESAYRDLRRLSNKVRQAVSAHGFFYGYSADEVSANMQVQEVRKLADTVVAGLRMARECLLGGK